MELEQALLERRTVRKYAQKVVPDEELYYLIDAARRASCARNDQRLRYVVARTPELVAKIFNHTAWAGAVAPRRDPVPGVSAPAAFIAVTGKAAEADTPLLQTDCGAAIQTIQLAAWGKGIGCCWLGSVDRKAIHALLELPEDTAILYIIALGYADEKPVSEDVDDPSKVKYYLDSDDLLHVPKLSVESLTVWK
ncbi:MAG: nitroreductase family protein [Lentisphaeria bacterium]|nr:nitroreductase family protein [Lentisphaeria bacterium]